MKTFTIIQKNGVLSHVTLENDKSANDGLEAMGLKKDEAIVIEGSHWAMLPEEIDNPEYGATS